MTLFFVVGSSKALYHISLIEQDDPFHLQEDQKSFLHQADQGNCIRFFHRIYIEENVKCDICISNDLNSHESVSGVPERNQYFRGYLLR